MSLLPRDSKDKRPRKVQAAENSQLATPLCVLCLCQPLLGPGPAAQAGQPSPPGLVMGSNSALDGKKTDEIMELLTWIFLRKGYGDWGWSQRVRAG